MGGPFFFLSSHAAALVATRAPRRLQEGVQVARFTCARLALQGSTAMARGGGKDAATCDGAARAQGLAMMRMGPGDVKAAPPRRLARAPEPGQAVDRGRGLRLEVRMQRLLHRVADSWTSRSCGFRASGNREKCRRITLKPAVFQSRVIAAAAPVSPPAAAILPGGRPPIPSWLQSRLPFPSTQPFRASADRETPHTSLRRMRGGTSEKTELGAHPALLDPQDGERRHGPLGAR